MILVVQEIVTWWTKRSRSGPAADRRRATPRRLVLPGAPEPDHPAATLAHHVVHCRERHGFEPETERFDVGPVALRQSTTAGCADIRYLGGRVEATWAWSFSCGAPRRSTHRRTVLTLRPGEWGRIAYNGRSSSMAGMAGWKYRLRVVNAALIEAPTVEPFRGEPVRVFEEMAHLR